MKHSFNPDVDINTELNDLKCQLIEEGMENYKLKQKVKELSKIVNKNNWTTTVVMFLIGVWYGSFLF